jgi:hypothetical protein
VDQTLVKKIGLSSCGSDSRHADQTLVMKIGLASVFFLRVSFSFDILKPSLVQQHRHHIVDIARPSLAKHWPLALLQNISTLSILSKRSSLQANCSNKKHRGPSLDRCVQPVEIWVMINCFGLLLLLFECKSIASNVSLLKV